MLDKKIGELVTENSLFASVLYYFGINFESDANSQLEALCTKKGLKGSFIIKKLQQIDTPNNYIELVKDFPIELVLSLLQQSHKDYLQIKIPFLKDIILQSSESHFSNKQLIKDLKTIFPVFVEDFITHIFKEEDTLFHYIKTLLHIKANPAEYAKLFDLLNTYHLGNFIDNHECCDEMKGIRELTGNYMYKEGAHPTEIILLDTLASFDKDLKIHANIEDEILFKKTLNLEDEVLEIFAQKIIQN